MSRGSHPFIGIWGVFWDLSWQFCLPSPLSSEGGSLWQFQREACSLVLCGSNTVQGNWIFRHLWLLVLTPVAEIGRLCKPRQEDLISAQATGGPDCSWELKALPDPDTGLLHGLQCFSPHHWWKKWGIHAETAQCVESSGSGCVPGELLFRWDQTCQAQGRYFLRAKLGKS